MKQKRLENWKTASKTYMFMIIAMVIPIVVYRFKRELLTQIPDKISQNILPHSSGGYGLLD